MNIFLLDKDPKVCAKYHADRHVVKMVCETTQILCTVLHKNGIEYGTKPTHSNHPSVLWAGLNINNFKWLHTLGLELAKEYYYRYGSRKKEICQHRYLEVLENMPIPNLIDIGEVKMEIQYCAIGDKYRNKHSNPVEAYREYYLKEKSHIWYNIKKEHFCYKFREVPSFISNFFVVPGPKNKGVQEQKIMI